MNKSNLKMLAVVFIATVTLAAGFLVINTMKHGDINLDGRVDALDLSIMSNNWTK